MFHVKRPRDLRTKWSHLPPRHQICLVPQRSLVRVAPHPAVVRGMRNSEFVPLREGHVTWRSVENPTQLVLVISACWVLHAS